MDISYIKTDMYWGKYLKVGGGMGDDNVGNLYNSIIHEYIDNETILNNSNKLYLELHNLNNFLSSIFGIVKSGGSAEDIMKLRDLSILVDRDEEGYLLQIFTKPTLAKSIERIRWHFRFGKRICYGATGMCSIFRLYQYSFEVFVSFV